MCNLNILINLNKQPIINCSFLNGVTSLSYKDNNDGDGIYIDKGLLYTSAEKLNLFEKLSYFKNSKLFISHQRIATSGKTVKYTQPFQNKDFVIAHNGILQEYEKKSHSDTFIVFKEFIKLFNKEKGSRETRITKVAEKLFKDEYGKWSIALYDKKTKNLYYFKDSSTDITFHINQKKSILYITTNNDNSIFLNVYNDKFDELIIQDYTLYRISFKDKIKVVEVADLDQRFKTISEPDIPKKSKPIKDWNPKNWIHGKKTDNYKTKAWNKYTEQYTESVYCEHCQYETYDILIHSGFGICQKCFNKYYAKIIKYERKIRDDKDVICS